MQEAVPFEILAKKVNAAYNSLNIKNRVIRYFPETNLQNGHDGLKKLAKKEGLDLTDLGPGQFVIFVNKRKNALKMFACGYLIAHLRLPDGERLNPETIQFIPKFFNGTRIDYSGALREVMKKQYPSFFGN